jgi:hypothetical protein
MTRQGRVLGLLSLALAAAIAHAQTAWPSFMKDLTPGPTQSAVIVSLPPGFQITAPEGGLAPDRAKWSGFWEGWACNQRSCDLKLVVESVSNEGASIVYGYGSATVAPVVLRVRAEFVGDELQATLPDGSRLSYRMRPSGDVEFVAYWKSGGYAAGILSKKAS